MSRARWVVAALLIVALLPALAVRESEPAEAARTYGGTPLDDVMHWAGEEARCGLSQDQLAAMMLAPTWAETGAPANQAPSPMTLSRWDNQDSLHAFGDPDSGFPRAFWHPGIGPWQFDDSGLGSPMTARERIDSFVSAAKAADTMAARWCVQQNLSFVWAPWAACSSGACLTIYNEIFVGGALTGMVRDNIVARGGGMVERTCEGAGQTGTFQCWRVDPALAQGHRSWTAPGFGPSPLTAPFYVYAAGGLEYRHWLPADTGYSQGIWATRPFGSNSRTSLTWHAGVELVDRGASPCPDIGVISSCSAQPVNGTYRTASGDFDGDNYDDVLWHAPGPMADFIWWGADGAGFDHTQVVVSGTYTPTAGDFDHDGRDDIFFYAAGAAGDAIWWGASNRTFTGTPKSVTGTYNPAGGDFDGDGFGDILWYAPGTAADAIWWGRPGRSFLGTRITANGSYRVVTSDFDDDGADDVMWHAPGPASDYVWWGAPGRTFATTAHAVSGTYTVAAGDLNGDGPADIIWYGPGAVTDFVWFGRNDRTLVPGPASIGGSYVPLVGDFDQAFTDDVLWYAPGTTADWITLST